MLQQIRSLICDIVAMKNKTMTLKRCNEFLSCKMRGEEEGSKSMTVIEQLKSTYLILFKEKILHIIHVCQYPPRNNLPYSSISRYIPSLFDSHVIVLDFRFFPILP